MTGTLRMQHIRDGQVLSEQVVENEIVSSGHESVIDVVMGKAHYFYYPSPIDCVSLDLVTNEITFE